jgi:hypothetical protein
MHYSDGDLVQVGDVVSVDVTGRGRVVASMDTGHYLPGEEGWSYLVVGVMVDTDFGGLIHYTAPFADSLTLLSRPAKG